MGHHRRRCCGHLWPRTRGDRDRRFRQHLPDRRRCFRTPLHRRVPGGRVPGGLEWLARVRRRSLIRDANHQGGNATRDIHPSAGSVRRLAPALASRIGVGGRQHPPWPAAPSLRRCRFHTTATPTPLRWGTRCAVAPSASRGRTGLPSLPSPSRPGLPARTARRRCPASSPRWCGPAAQLWSRPGAGRPIAIPGVRCSQALTGSHFPDDSANRAAVGSSETA